VSILIELDLGSRTDFSGPLSLLPVEKAKEDFIQQDYKAAVCGLNPETETKLL
jgi:hypothetical protein